MSDGPVLGCPGRPAPPSRRLQPSQPHPDGLGREGGGEVRLQSPQVRGRHHGGGAKVQQEHLGHLLLQRGDHGPVPVPVLGELDGTVELPDQLPGAEVQQEGPGGRVVVLHVRQKVVQVVFATAVLWLKVFLAGELYFGSAGITWI